MQFHTGEKTWHTTNLHDNGHLRYNAHIRVSCGSVCAGCEEYTDDLRVVPNGSSEERCESVHLLVHL